MATVHHADVQGRQDVDTRAGVEHLPEIRIYSHTPLFYWWPVWLTGYILAVLTYFQGEVATIGGRDYLMHPSKNLGVFFTVVFLLVITLTNISLRGMLSVVVIVSILFFTVLFAWLGWWDDIMALLPYLAIHMNLGFYLFFSTGLFIVWALAFFFFDRMSYWRVRPGQMTYERVVGGGERSYDTRGMVFEKHPADFFKHLILGLGAGDLRIITTGARSEEITVHNVMFVDHKVRQIQKLIAVKPDDTPDRVVTAGNPD
jgi:signal transduction histidine kinase